MEPKYPSKRYLHFDNITAYNKKVEKYVIDFEKNPKHSFLPLLYNELIYEKYNNSAEENKIRNVKIVPVKEKIRPIMYASHVDNFIYKHYGIEINDLYNSSIKNSAVDDSVIAYRKSANGKSNIHHSAEIINYIKSHDNCLIYIGDYSDFFGTINHNYLKDMINKLYKDRMPLHQFKIFKSLTKYSYINKEDVNSIVGEDKILRKKEKRSYFNSFKEFRDFKKKEKLYEGKKEKVLKTNFKDHGIPQGTAISAIYSNIYMTEIDTKITEIVSQYKGLYRRYSDDFIVILPNIDKSNLEYVKKSISNMINEAKLILHPNKTVTIQYLNGKLIDNDDNKIVLDYLGFVFDGETVKMREKSIYKYYRSAYKLIKKGEVVSIRKGFIGKKARLTYKRKLYQKYHAFGERTDRKYKYKKREFGTFITYAYRSQQVFDEISPYTLNLMKKQIDNHQKYIKRKIIKTQYKLRNFNP
ncbi:reverse transcriptase domain-containing protein [Marinilactibacillus sp. GCM10026970]|uniref:reverse transcriptase domain-containing protein n=1 Tax=Marinilactibacillus sp. GCM10026970 TaxID=3252642 RepID=UPI003622AC5B